MELVRITELFGVKGVSETVPLNMGHINSTYKVTSEDGAYILQSLNSSVFREPEAVMANISVVERAFAESGVTDVAVPEYLLANGRNYAAINGEIWRMYRYIEAGPADDSVTGYAFGTFIRVLSGARLRPVIKGYHDFDGYYSRLKGLLAGRPELISGDTVKKLDELSGTIKRVFTPDIPERAIHGDAKADNVIAGRCSAVIDLDTAMYGYAALDYGDMIRSVSKGAQPDLERIKAATSGFAEGLGGVLTPAEMTTLFYGILWTTGELAVRYLTDCISEERYFRGRKVQECRSRADELLRQLETFNSLCPDIQDIINSSFA